MHLLLVLLVDYRAVGLQGKASIQQSMKSYKKWGKETHRQALLYEAILFLTIVLKPYFDEL